VSISVNLPLCGSYIDNCRPDVAIGITLADGWLEPSLQKSGLRAGRMRAVNHTWPFSSIMGLCISVLLSQMGLSPHTADGANRSFLSDGVLGSRTGCSTSVDVAVFGSRIGT